MWLIKFNYKVCNLNIYRNVKALPSTKFAIHMRSSHDNDDDEVQIEFASIWIELSQVMSHSRKSTECVTGAVFMTATLPLLKAWAIRFRMKAYQYPHNKDLPLSIMTFEIWVSWKYWTLNFVAKSGVLSSLNRVHLQHLKFSYSAVSLHYISVSDCMILPQADFPIKCVLNKHSTMFTMPTNRNSLQNKMQIWFEIVS